MTKLTPPFTVQHNDDAWWVEDAEGRRFAFTYYRDPPLVGTDGGNVRHEGALARQVATTVARLPSAVFLDDDERAALERFIGSQGEPMTVAQATRRLLRDALIGIGDMPLPKENRGPGARRSRQSR